MHCKKTGNEAAKTDDVQQKTGAEAQQPQKQGWSVIYMYNSRESYYEYEKMSFSAGGIIKTSDGWEIDFSLQLNMQREYTSEETINIKAKDGAINDPLVINFPGTAADLSSSKFSFDLESDGEDGTISLPKLGSGFLALDKNNDGTVSNISGLFGPYTGDGFLELAAYDEDGNNWIDENDSIFEEIRIWTNDTEGNDSLNTLISQGVGAIYLANLTSPFTVKDSENNTAGQIATTGIYLNEDGTPGVLQQVNIVT